MLYTWGSDTGWLSANALQPAYTGFALVSEVDAWAAALSAVAIIATHTTARTKLRGVTTIITDRRPFSPRMVCHSTTRLAPPDGVCIAPFYVENV